MTVVIACMVCARPLESLLTSGLHAGVALMALVAIGVVGALVRGAVAVIRQDADDNRTPAAGREATS